jgi:hypothetical protein
MYTELRQRTCAMSEATVMFAALYAGTKIVERMIRGRMSDGCQLCPG